METLEKVFTNALDNNPYFNAGAGLFGVGMALSVFRKSSQYMNLFIKRNFTLTLEVASHDRSYPWVLSWIYMKSKLRRGAGQHLSVDTQLQTSNAGKLLTNFDFIPSTGIHYVFHNRKLIQVERVRSSQTLQGAKSAPFESLTLKTFGTDAKFFTNLLVEAKDLAISRDEGSTVIYKAYGHEWRQFGHPKRKRPLDSVILSSFTNESIVADLEEFIKSENWYLSRGIPYRRGYMFHGPPGCGKSSLITSLAGFFDFSLCVVSLSEIGMSSDRLDYLLTHAPYRSFIVIEDVDAALPRLPQYTGMTNVTMSGLLNALDGVASSEGRILFMTTNYIEKLDPALIRPGRVDRVFFIGNCDLEQMRKMLARFYNSISQQLIEDMVLRIGPGRISPAQFQGHLLKFKENPQMAYENLDEFLKTVEVKSADR